MAIKLFDDSLDEIGAERFFRYQIVVIPALEIAESRVASGSPKLNAVAAIIRSGMSGTVSRETRCTAHATRSSSGATVNPASGSERAAVNRSMTTAGSLPFFDEIYDFH
jgi:hypothetical protein